MVRPSLGGRSGGGGSRGGASSRALRRFLARCSRTDTTSGVVPRTTAIWAGLRSSQAHRRSSSWSSLPSEPRAAWSSSSSPTTARRGWRRSLEARQAADERQVPTGRAPGVGQAAAGDADRPGDLVVPAAPRDLVAPAPEDQQGLGDDVLGGVGVHASPRVREHRRPRVPDDRLEGVGRLRRDAHTSHCPASGTLHAERSRRTLPQAPTQRRSGAARRGPPRGRTCRPAPGCPSTTCRAASGRPR